MDEKAEVEDLRFKIMRKYPFFGSLIHRVPVSFTEKGKDKGLKGPVTNGKEIFLNTERYTAQTNDENLTDYGHELLHCSFLHAHRIKSLVSKPEEHKIANMAGDYLVNAILKDMGFPLPEQYLYHPELTPDKYSLEELTALLKKLMPPSCGGQGKKPNKNDPHLKNIEGAARNFNHDLQDPHGMDGDEDGEKDDGEGEMTQADINEAEAEMQGIIEQAANQLRMAGKGSPMLDRMIERWKTPKIPWEVLLEDWMEKKTKTDISWNRPHRRSYIIDVYLPIKSGYRMGHIGVAIDLSGSIGNREIGLFVSQMKYIFERCNPSKVTVVTFDDGIRNVYEFDELPDPATIKLRGGGGTDFRPPFAYFDKIYKEDPDEFEGLIFMTDLCGPFPDKAPEYPVAFLSTYKGAQSPGWGDLIDGSAIMEEDK